MYGTASRMIFAKSKILRSSRGCSTHGAAHRANAQCAKVNQFYFAFAYIIFFFIPVCFFICFALLCLTLILLLFPVCFSFTIFLFINFFFISFLIILCNLLG